MDEIEKFLRQVAARRQQAQQQQEAPARPPVVPYVHPEVTEATLIDRPEITSRPVDSSAEFAERSSHLGAKARRADDEMEQHLHQKFDHDVGRLGGRSDAVATEYTDLESAPYVDKGSQSLANALLEVFRSPNSIRNAIILKEVLERPEHRW